MSQKKIRLAVDLTVEPHDAGLDTLKQRLLALVPAARTAASAGDSPSWLRVPTRARISRARPITSSAPEASAASMPSREPKWWMSMRWLVPAAAAIGSLASPWWATARVKATDRVMR